MLKYLLPLSYMLVSALWIVFSDVVIDILIPDSNLKFIINSTKALAFVLATGGVLFVLLRRYEAKQNAVRTRLSDQERGFRHLFTNNPQPMWIYDRTALRFLEVNHAAVQKYGYTRDEFLKMSILNVRPPEEVDRLMNELARTGKLWVASGEWQHRLKSGEIIDVEVSNHPVIYEGLSASMITINDITGRKRVQRELREVEARLEHVLNDVEEVVRIIDPNTYDVLYISPAVEKVYGRKAEAFYRDRDLLLAGVHPDDREMMRQKRLERPQAGGWDIEFRVVHPDGQIRWIHDRSRVIVDENEKPVRIEGFTFDITEKKQRQEEQQKNVALEQALAHQAELSRLRQRYMSMMSHEFRSPLATLFASMEILERYHDRLTPERRAEHIVKAKVHIRRMVELLDDILGLMYAENIGQALTRVPVDMAALLRVIADEMQPRLLPAQNFALEIPETPVVYPGDEKMLRQAVENLVSNAIKYSPDGGEISIRLSCTPDELQLHICDRGIGIPDRDIPALFEVFQRASNVGNIPGTGLGLAMVKEVVDRHHGRIEVTGEVGKGTAFTLYLPLTSTAS